MDTTQSNGTLKELAARLEELERELASLRAEQLASMSQPTARVHVAQPAEPNGRRSRRGMLRTALGVVAAAVGAGALFQGQTGTASADGAETATTFTSSSGAAVRATGSSGANGVEAYSDSGYGVVGRSNSGYGVVARSSGTALYAISGGTAVLAQSNGIAVDASSLHGPAVRARGGGPGNPKGVGLRVEGLLQMQAPVGGAGPVGQFTMPPGVTTLTVPTPAATPSSVILLTPLRNPLAFLWISARGLGFFTISASRPVPPAVTIQYLIVN